MFLATTAIQDFWDLESTPLLLGPWCLQGEKNKKLVEGKDYIMVPSPWKPVNKVKEAADYTMNIYEEFLPRFSAGLNSINKVSYPPKYWRILLGPWLLHFIGVFYERYKRVEHALHEFPDCYTYTVSEPLDNLTPLNTLEFVHYQINDDFYNLKLFSFIINRLYPERTKQINCSFVSKTAYSPPAFNWKGKLFEEFLEATNVFLKSPIILSDMYHLNNKDMLLLSLQSGINTINFRHFTPLNNRYPVNNFSLDLRERLINHKETPDIFLSLLYDILPYVLPACYLENYALYKKEMKGPSSVKIIGSAVGWVFNERFKFFAAEAAVKDIKIIEFQHGAGYGSSLVNLYEDLSLEKDVFFTWGWSAKENNKTKPLPCPYLSKLKDRHRFMLDNLLMVGTTMPRYHLRFNTDIFPDDMPKYFIDKKIFLNCLSDGIKNVLLYRPFPYEYGWQEKESIRQEVPNVKFVEDGKLVDLMKRVKLAVIDHPYTSFLEALIINVPCVFYWDHEVCLMRPEAEPYFEELRRVNILFKGPLEAARQVNRIFNDPKDWWLSEEVQDVRRKFCRRFAYAREDWMKIWAIELRGIYAR